MLARLLTIVVVALLIVPFGVVNSPTTTRAPWPEISVTAQAKKHKKKQKKPKFTTVTRTIRQPVTRTFANPASITIVDAGFGPGGDDPSPAAVYPSTIAVSGFPAGSTISDVNLIINDFNHLFASDVDIELSHTSPLVSLFVMGDSADASPGAAANLDIVLDDEAAALLPAPPGGALTSGTFRPANHDEGIFDSDVFDAPAPAPGGGTTLSAFDGGNPHGTWQLWVMDDTFTEAGSIASGWALQITAEHEVQVQEQVRVGKDKKKKKGKGKGRH